MATPSLTLTNSVLRELNETELTSSTFSSSRGIQTAIKDFINKGIHDIYNETGEIPLLYARTTQNLTTGDSEYDFPTDFRKIDRDSFTIAPRDDADAAPVLTTKVADTIDALMAGADSTAGKIRVFAILCDVSGIDETDRNTSTQHDTAV